MISSQKNDWIRSFVEGSFEAADCEGASAGDGCHEVGDGSELEHLANGTERRRKSSGAGGWGGWCWRVIDGGNSGDGG